ncbi:unnamed protein product [[Candida] boidinii]|nr:unnamed protein product [[Candida] boidinii]
MKRRELAKEDPSAYFLATLADTFNLHEEEQNIIESAKSKKNSTKLPGATNAAANNTSADSPFQHGLTPSAILQTPLPFTAKTPGSVLPTTQNYEDDKSKNNYSWTGRVKAGVISNVFKDVIDGVIPGFEKMRFDTSSFILTPPDEVDLSPRKRKDSTFATDNLGSDTSAILHIDKKQKIEPLKEEDSLLDSLWNFESW